MVIVMEYVIVILLSILLIVSLVILVKQFSFKKQDNRLEKEFQNYTLETNKLLTNLNHELVTAVLKNNMEVKDSLMKNINEQLNSIRNNLEVKLVNEFDKINRTFTLNNESLKKIGDEFKTSEREITKTINDNLDRINMKVEERLNKGFEETKKTFVDVIERLSKIDEAQKKIETLSSNIMSLQDILNDKKTRGNFGEVQLELLLKDSFGDNNYKIYEIQKTLGNDKIADAYLHLPGENNDICIDSKFPLEHYKIMKDSSKSKEEVVAATKLFKQDVKKHIDDISSKYIIEGITANQAVMFVPSEAVFAEINAYYEDLLAYANKKRVSITSPTTLMALLKVVILAYRDSELNKNAKVLFEELEKLGKDFRLYSVRWESLQKDIEKVSKDVKEINTTTGKLTNKFEKIQSANIKYIEEEKTNESTID